MRVKFFILLISTLSLFLQGTTALGKVPTKFRVILEDSNNYPFEYAEKNKRSGFHIDLITEVAKALRWDVEWIPVPWTRARVTLASDEGDAISFFVPAGGKAEKDLFLDGDNIMHYAAGALYIRKSRGAEVTYKGGDLNFLNKYTFGIIYGDAIDDALTHFYPQLKVDRTAKNYQQLFKMLEERRFDIVIATGYGLRNASFMTPQFQKEITGLPNIIGARPAYLAFSSNKKGQTKARAFAETFKKFKATTKYTELVQKYQIEKSSLNPPP
jgi:ABC-type amino acid transport substrate-binding protein